MNYFDLLPKEVIKLIMRHKSSLEIQSIYKKNRLFTPIISGDRVLLITKNGKKYYGTILNKNYDLRLRWKYKILL